MGTLIKKSEAKALAINYYRNLVKEIGRTEVQEILRKKSIADSDSIGYKEVRKGVQVRTYEIFHEGRLVFFSDKEIFGWVNARGKFCL